jgi:hypothetical protein
MINVRKLNSRHRKTFDDVMTLPPKSGIKWDDVVSLIHHLGGKVNNGNGSRRRFVLEGSLFLTHQPHPGSVMDKGAVKGLQAWFEESVGVNYD